MSEKINLAHRNELHSDYLRQLAEKRDGWEVISSMSGNDGKALILWEAPNGIWIEERGWENRTNIRLGLTCLVSPECARKAVEKLIGQ